jgi:hypothetical protein
MLPVSGWRRHERNWTRYPERRRMWYLSRDYDKLNSIKDNNVRSIIKQSAAALEAALTCARLFDEEENVADLFEGLRQAINSQVLSFNASWHRRTASGATCGSEETDG